MAFPPAHLLVGAGAAEVVRAFVPLPRGRAWLIAGILGVVPDLDMAAGLVRGQATAFHGTFTHSVLATVVVGLVAWAVAGGRWGAVCAAGYGSHLLVDLLDARGPTNVLLGWPFTLEQPFAIAKLFPTVSFLHGHGPVAAFLSLFRPAVLTELVVQTLVGVGVLLALLGIAWAIRGVRGGPPADATG